MKRGQYISDCQSIQATRKRAGSGVDISFSINKKKKKKN